MRGHEPLIAMRMARHHPTLVCIHVGHGRWWVADHWHEQGFVPELHVEASDPIARLDLRCIVGLTVDVSGDEEHSDRIKRVFNACVKAGAGRVIGAINRVVGGERKPVEYLDSAEVLTWQ